MTNENTENKLVGLVAMDRIFIAASSMDNRLKRMRTEAAGNLDIGESFRGERAYARVETEDTMKARGMKAGIEAFCRKHPRISGELHDLIEEKRRASETTLYFGMKPGATLNTQDYLGVMRSLGLTEHVAHRLYPELLEVSRRLEKARDYEERSVQLG